MVAEVGRAKGIWEMTSVNSDHAPVEVGSRLGFYRIMSESGPVTPTGLAKSALVSKRFAQEWLETQAQSGYVEFDAATGRYANWCSLPQAA